MMRKTINLFVALAMALVICGALADVSWAGDGIWTQTGPCMYDCGAAHTLLSAPSNGQVLYAILRNQLYKSTDAGESWSLLLPYPPYSVYTLAVSHQDSSRLYAVMAVDVGGEPAVYVSTDGGLNWTHSLELEWRSTKLAIAPGDDQTVYAGQGDIPMGPPTRIWRTSDGGQSWSDPFDPSPFRVDGLTVDPDNSEVVYALSDRGLLRSTDGCVSFEDVGIHRTLHSLAICPSNSDLLYLATWDGVYLSHDAGASWLPGGDLGEMQVSTILVDPHECRTVYIGTSRGGVGPSSSGILASLDGGVSWNPLLEGMGPRDMSALAIDGQTYQNIFAGTRAGTGIWKYTFGPASQQDYGLTINDGAIQTDSPDVTLSLTARPGTTEMMLSNDGSFADASWEPFAAQKDWTLEAYEGTAAPSTVYARFRTFGDVSGLYHDDIVVVGGGPVGGATTRGRDFAFLAPWTTWPGVLLACASLAWMWLKRIRVGQ